MSGASSRGCCDLSAEGVVDICFVLDALLDFGVGGICTSLFCERLSAEMSGIGALTARLAATLAGVMLGSTNLVGPVLILVFCCVVLTDLDMQDFGKDTADLSDDIGNGCARVFAVPFADFNFGFFLAGSGAVSLGVDVVVTINFLRGGSIASLLGGTADEFEACDVGPFAMLLFSTFPLCVVVAVFD